MHAVSPVLEPRTAVESRGSGTHQVINSHESVGRLSATLPRQSRRSGIIVSWPLAATVLAVAGVGMVQPWNWHGTPAAVLDSVHEPVSRVEVTSPSRATAEKVVLPGTLRPWQTATLHARASGFVKAWYHDLGAAVHAGDVLAEIDTPELDQELAQGESLASEADSAVVQAQAEKIEAEADLKVAEAQLVRSQAELSLAHSVLVRREQLVTRNVIVQEEYETALREKESRTAVVAAAESDVLRRRASLKTRDAVIAARESTARSRWSNVKRLKELQGFQRIVAPFDGVVIRRAAEVGMLVGPGTEPLFAMEDMSRIRVQVQVPQTHSAALRVGLAAQMTLPEAMASSVTGEITRMADSVDAASRTMLVEIELANETRRLQPGSYSRVTLDVPQNGSAWTIPANTILMRVNGPHVMVVDASNHVNLRPVSLGRDLGRQVVVNGGILGDERLVVNPRDGVADGARVEVGLRNQPELAARYARPHTLRLDDARVPNSDSAELVSVVKGPVH